MTTPLDPVIAQIIPLLPLRDPDNMTPQSARDALSALAAARAAVPPPPVMSAEDSKVKGAAGFLAARVYRNTSGTSPTVLFFHGGGFVMGDLDTHDALCRTLASESGSRVLSVDYRLAPEYPFPAAIEDGFAAVKWIEDKATELEIDPNAIAVVGDSAGGNIAAVMCLLAKANKDVPHIAFQMMFYPSIALTRELLSRPFGQGYRLDDRAIQWFYSHYMPRDADPLDLRRQRREPGRGVDDHAGLSRRGSRDMTAARISRAVPGSISGQSSSRS